MKKASKSPAKSLAKTPAESAPNREPVIMTELVLPSHTNALGTIFGGVVMSWIDVAGAIAAMQYSRSHVVTVSVDYLHFIAPIKTGFTVKVEATVTYAGTTSMEVQILVFSENSITGDRRQATHAYLTYVAVDEFNRPRKVPKFVASTPEEKRALAEAEKRRAARLEFREIM